MFHVPSESLFIRLLTTSKMFLAWSNINLKLLKIGCNQTKYVGRGTCLEWLPSQRNPLLLWIIRVGGKHLVTNGIAWCPVTHTSAAQ